MLFVGLTHVGPRYHVSDREISDKYICSCKEWQVGDLGTRVSCAKNGSTDRDGVESYVQGTKYYVAVKIGRIHSQPRGVPCWRCSLLPNYFGHLFVIELYRSCHQKGLWNRCHSWCVFDCWLSGYSSVKYSITVSYLVTCCADYFLCSQKCFSWRMSIDKEMSSFTRMRWAGFTAADDNLWYFY